MSPRNSGVIETPHQRILGILVKINHYIAAEDQIEFSFKLDGIHQVEGSENHILLKGRRNRIAVLPGLDKILALPAGGEGANAFVIISSIDSRA